MSIYSKPTIPWESEGVVPPLGQRVWIPDQKPPADWWNYFFYSMHSCFAVLDTELEPARGSFPTLNDRLDAIGLDISDHTEDSTNPHSVSHSQTNPAGIDPTSTDVTKNKHISNADAKSWTDHVAASGNVHSTQHGQLSQILGFDPSSTDTVRNKHVANSDMKALTEHAANSGNTHNTQHSQLSGVTGVNPSSTDTTRSKHVSDADAKSWVDHAGASGNPHATLHSQLTQVVGIDPTSTDVTKNKHISNADAKSWTDHTTNQVDPSSSDTTRSKHVSNADAKSWSEHAASAHVPPARLISTPAGSFLTGGGDLSANRSLAVDAAGIRNANSLALNLEVRNDNPTTPALGRIWIRQDLM